MKLLEALAASFDTAAAVAQTSDTTAIIATRDLETGAIRFVVWHVAGWEITGLSLPTEIDWEIIQGINPNLTWRPYDSAADTATLFSVLV